MLEVLTGSFRALESAFLARLREVKGGDPWTPVLVVVPSRRLADRLQRLVALGAPGGEGQPSAAVEFLTFKGLSQRLVLEAGRLDKPVLGDGLFYDRLVDRLLRRGAFFEGRYRGLSGALRSSVKDLDDAGIRGRTVLEQYREGLFGPPQDAPELGRLLALQAAFAEEVDRLRVLPPAEVVRRATEAAPESRFLAAQKGVFYYGFYDLTGLQADFFQAVAKHHPATLFFPYKKDDPDMAFAARFLEAQASFGAPPRALSEPARKDAVLEVFNAAGSADELWKAAKGILRLVEQGCAWDEIGVCARTLDPYRPYLARVFEENGIPFHTTAEQPLLREPFAKQCLAVLTWARRDFPAVAVEDWLASPFCRAGSPGWGRIVRGLAIHQGWLQWEGRLEDFMVRGDESLAPRGDGAALLEALRGWKQGLADLRGGWAQRARLAAAFLRSTLDFEAAPEPAKEGVEQVLLSLAKFEALGAPPEDDEFLDTLEEAFRRAALPLSGEANRGVRVLDAMSARGESFRALFLLGLKEKAFPRLIREDPFLRDRHRAMLRDRSGWWLSTKLGGYDEERLLFALLRDSASERLVLSYPRSDEEGKAQSPSLYLLELRRARGGTPVQAVPLRPAAKLRSEAQRLSPAEASLLLALEERDPSALDRALKTDGARREAVLSPARVLGGFDEAGAFDGLLDGDPSDLLGGKVSPTAFERLARCPFQFLAQDLLKLEEPEEPEERGVLPPHVAGTIYHKVLERFFSAWAEQGAGTAFPEELFSRALEEGFSGRDAKRLGLYPLLWTAERRLMEAALRDALRRELLELAESGWKPAHFELELSGPLPGDDRLRVRGRADRVDVGPEGLRVVDYKRKVRLGKLETALGRGSALQLAFYLELAAERLGAPAGGAALVSIESESSRRMDRRGWAEVRPLVLGHVKRLAQGLRAGRFFIHPDSNERGYCGYCGFASLCRKSHGPSAKRAESAPGYSEHHAMSRAQAAGGAPAAGGELG